MHPKVQSLTSYQWELMISSYWSDPVTATFDCYLAYCYLVIRYILKGFYFGVGVDRACSKGSYPY